VTRTWRVVKRTAVSFYDDQMTQHAAAASYYTLMSLFPALLLGISLLGLLGQYPETYNAVYSYLRDVVPPATLNAVNDTLRSAIRQKGNATAGLVLGTVTALYGLTGVLEALRRALNVVFRVEKGRSFLHRKARDVASIFILMSLILITLIAVFVGGSLADHVFGHGFVHAWNLVRWPLAILVAMFAFAYVYYATPDLPDDEKKFRLMTPGAIVAVIIWIIASWGFSQYLSNYRSLNAIYGTFAGAIILVGWVWLTQVALLIGAELNAALTRERESGASDLTVAPAPQ
jgi:membrane protein